MSGQAPRAAQDESPKRIETNTENKNNSAPHSPPSAVDQKTAVKNQGEGAKITTDDDNHPIKVMSLPEVFIKSNKDGWDKALVILTGLIVVVGGFQIYFLWGTVTATRDNAATARASADMAVAAMRQWVEIKNWSHEYKVRGDDGSQELWVTFVATNPTKLPFWLMSTKTRSPWGEHMEAHKILLTPNEPYTVDFGPIPLDEKRRDAYLKNGLATTVFGYIVIEDCFEENRDQIFTGLLHCTQTGTTFRAEWIPNCPYKIGDYKQYPKWQKPH